MWRHALAAGGALVLAATGLSAASAQPSGGPGSGPAASPLSVAGLAASPQSVAGRPSRVAPDLARAQGMVTAFVTLDTPSGADVADHGGSPAAVEQARRTTQAVAAQVVPDELSVRTAGAAHPQRVATVTNLVPGTLVTGDAAQVRALADHHDVTGVYRVLPKKADDAATATLTQTLAAWQSTGQTGKGVTVGIIDSGVDYTHADLGGPGTAAAYDEAYGTDGTGPVPAGTYDPAKIDLALSHDLAGPHYATTGVPVPDDNPIDAVSPAGGHGTHVAGIAAGYGVTADGSTFRGDCAGLGDLSGWQVGPGSAPQATIVALKVFGDDGDGTTLTIPALDRAADPDGDGDLSDRLDVVNLSLDAPFYAADDPDALAVDRLSALGTVVVTAAGNSGDLEDAGGPPGSAASAIAVADSLGVEVAPGWGVDTLNPSSSRGVHGSLGWAKPDVAAPGTSVWSAQSGSGTGAVSMTGTSMASPHVAGIAALVRQAHPGWSSAQVKAAVVGTAVHDVTLGGGRTDVLGPARVGAGRVDALRATTTPVLAWDTDAPAATSVSFGVVDVGAPLTLRRTVTVQNTGDAPVALDARYVASTTAGGATLTVSPPSLTVPAQGSALLTVRLAADPATLARDRDPTQEATQAGVAREHVTRVSGRLELSGDGVALRVPVQAAPRPTSDLTASADQATGALRVTRRTIDPATGWGSFATPLLLGATSPALDPVTSGTTSASMVAAGDLRDVGWASTAPAAAAAGDEPSSGHLDVGIATAGPWADLGAVLVPEVLLDLDGDGTPDLVTEVSKMPDADVTVAATYDATSGTPLAVAPVDELGGDADATVFDGSTLVVPIPLTLVPAGARPQVTVAMLSWYAPGGGGVVDQAGPFETDPYDPPLWFASNLGVRQTSLVTGDQTIAVHPGSGDAPVDAQVLVLYPGNPTPDTRAQVLDVRAGGATPQPAATPSPTGGPASPSASDLSAAGLGGRPSAPGGPLASTGTRVGVLVGLAVVALAAGTTLVAVRRRGARSR